MVRIVIGRMSPTLFAQLLLTVGITLVAVSAQAQTGHVSEITGAFTSAFVRGDYDVPHYEGWLTSMSISVTSTVSVVVEAAGQYRDDRFNDSFGVFTLVGGPKFTWAAGRARPFAQTPMGFARNWTIFRGYAPLSYASNVFVFQPGGGADVRLTERVYLRLAGDWLVGKPWYGVAWQMWNIRFGTGLTYRL